MPVVILLLALFAGTAARADATSDAREHFNKAQTHYALGEFEQAIAEFREAYRLRHEPAILFNIAQAMRQLGEWKQAYFYYSQYVAQKPDAPNRADAESFAAQMKRKADAEEDAEKLSILREGGQPKEPIAVPMAAVQQDPAMKTPAKRYAGYALLGAGALAEGLAFVFHGGAQSAADEFNQKYAAGSLTAADTHLKSDADSKGKLAAIALATGGVLLVTGALLSFAF